MKTSPRRCCYCASLLCPDDAEEELELVEEARLLALVPPHLEQVHLELSSHVLCKNLNLNI